MHNRPRVTGRVVIPATVEGFVRAVLRVRIEDVSFADREADSFGDAIVADVTHIVGRDTVVPFVVSGPATIDPGADYSVRAWIEQCSDAPPKSQRRLFSDRRYPVLTRGAPDDVTIILSEQ